MIGWPLLLIAGWLAATISGAVGFGGALLLLPALVYVIGAKSAVPVLTIAQLLGNLSRAGFGWREIRWRPVLLFGAGAVPASLLGSVLFVALPPGWTARLIGVFLLAVVALRHARLGRRAVSQELLPLAGSAVGFLSALAGSAGPLGRGRLPRPPAAGDGVCRDRGRVRGADGHLTKSLAYGRYAAITREDLCGGLALGGVMVIGSWTGRRLIERLGEKGFGLVVEILLLVVAMSLAIG